MSPKLATFRRDIQPRLADGRNFALEKASPLITASPNSPLASSLPTYQRVYKGVAKCFTYLHNRDRARYEAEYARTLEHATPLLGTLESLAHDNSIEENAYLGVAGALKDDFKFLATVAEALTASGLWK